MLSAAAELRHWSGVRLKLRSIQVLRGVAAMAVVVHHAFPGRTQLGAAGVDLFFVISGFIMATSASGRQPLEFLADRAWRIYPMWLIALAPWLLISPQTPLEVVRGITLWPVFGDQFLNPALGVGWTLSFELVFYLAFALALATRPAIPIVLYGLCLAVGFESRHVLFWFLGSPLVFEFLLGVAISRAPRVADLGVPMVFAGFLWFALVPSTYYDQAFGPGALFRALFWGLPAAMIVYGAWSLEEWFGRRMFPVPFLLGCASYSIYLVHPLVFLEFSGVPGLLLSAVAGVAMYLLVERQVMRARPKWGTRRMQATSQSAASASLGT